MLLSVSFNSNFAAKCTISKVSIKATKVSIGRKSWTGKCPTGKILHGTHAVLGLPCTLMPGRRRAACMHEFACMALLWVAWVNCDLNATEQGRNADRLAVALNKKELLVSRPHWPPHINAEVHQSSRSRMKRILHDSASFEVFFPSPISVTFCQIAGPKTPA